MVLKVIWRKIKLYKRFELDIWGLRFLNATNKKLRVIKMFNVWDVERTEFYRQKRVRYVYRVDRSQPFRVLRRHSWSFVTRRLSRLFYLTLSYSQFRKLARLASKKEGSWESSFVMLVENRLIGMLYRMQIIMSVFELRHFVLRGQVYVNQKKVTYCNAAVDYTDVVTFKDKVSSFLRYSIAKRFDEESLYFNIPRYMFVSYKMMFAFVYREPRRRDLAFPIKAIDVYRSADFC